MNYMTAFDISASGMTAEKARVDAVAMNLANVNSTRSADGTLYRPLTVVTAARTGAMFEGYLNRFLSDGVRSAGVDVVDVHASDAAPRMVYQPGHPSADERGFVAYPDINPAAEMIALMEALRSYEANVQAMNGAKTMALKALEIGAPR